MPIHHQQINGKTRLSFGPITQIPLHLWQSELANANCSAPSDLTGIPILYFLIHVSVLIDWVIILSIPMDIWYKLKLFPLPLFSLKTSLMQYCRQYFRGLRRVKVLFEISLCCFRLVLVAFCYMPRKRVVKNSARHRLCAGSLNVFPRHSVRLSTYFATPFWRHSSSMMVRAHAQTPVYIRNKYAWIDTDIPLMQNKKGYQKIDADSYL